MRLFCPVLFPSISLCALALLCGCGGPTPPNGTDAGSDAGTVIVSDAGTDAGTDGGVDAGSNYTAVCTAATTAPCQDQAILALDLKKPVAPGLITNSAAGAGWVSVVDATAGVAAGSLSPPTDAYVYGKFTAAGLTKVMIGDEAAYDSMGWDIAFRRYVIRLNGGVSGPSCVGAAIMPLGTSYDGLASEPGGAVYRLDDFYKDSPAACTFVDDGQGLGTSPATALDAFYAYTGCVETTGRIFVVRTAEGRKVKLVIDAYYFPSAAQTYCNTSHSKQTGSTAANLSLRWSFLD